MLLMEGSMPPMIIPPSAHPVQPRPRRASTLLSWHLLTRDQRDALAVRVRTIDGTYLTLPILPGGVLALPVGYALGPIAPHAGGSRA
jgi:hypothetical protein